MQMLGAAPLPGSQAREKTRIHCGMRRLGTIHTKEGSDSVKQQAGMHKTRKSVPCRATLSESNSVQQQVTGVKNIVAGCSCAKFRLPRLGGSKVLGQMKLDDHGTTLSGKAATAGIARSFLLFLDTSGR